jgi:hypothetical protein
MTVSIWTLKTKYNSDGGSGHGIFLEEQLRLKLEENDVYINLDVPIRELIDREDHTSWI